MKASEVDHPVGSRLLSCAEENRSAEDALETLNDAAIMPAVFGQVKELEDFCGGLKSHHTAFLADCESGDPNRNEAVLAVGQSKIRVSDDVKEVLAVPAPMHLLCWRWWAKRKTTRQTAARNSPSV